MELETIQSNIQKMYYESLISQLKKNKQNYSYLENLLDKLNNNMTETETNTIVNTDTEIKSEDDYIYKKEWNKLNNIHKIIKLKEYVNKLPISNSEKDELKTKLVSLVKSKKITKKTSVIYDIVNCRIINIPCLQLKNNKYDFTIKV